jgi:hypothetical protein
MYSLTNHAKSAAVLFTCLISLGAHVAPANAHKPIFSDGSAQNADVAIYIDDIDISYVVYHEVTAEANLLWLSFDGNAGQRVFAQLGVPFTERLEDFRPALALLGPGLPEVDLPFNIPDDLGGLLLTSDDVVEPEFFHEPFTGTDSWIMGDLETVLSQNGRHYFVAFVPDGTTGKLWVAPGKAEQFGLDDILSLPATIQQVREFHEVSSAGYPCFLPVLAIGFLLFGGFRLCKIRRGSFH